MDERRESSGNPTGKSHEAIQLHIFMQKKLPSLVAWDYLSDGFKDIVRREELTSLWSVWDWLHKNRTEQSLIDDTRSTMSSYDRQFLYGLAVRIEPTSSESWRLFLLAEPDNPEAL